MKNKKKQKKQTYPCGSWAGLSPQLLPSYPTFFCPLVSPTPSKAPSYLCTVRESPTRSPEFGHKKQGAPLAKPPPESRPRGRETERRSFFPPCFISTQVRLLCESSALLQPQTASPPPPSSTGSTTASLLADWRRRRRRRRPTSLRTAAPLTGGRESSGGET